MDYIRPRAPVDDSDLSILGGFQSVFCIDIPPFVDNFTRYRTQEDVELDILIYQAFGLDPRRKALPGEKCQIDNDCYQDDFKGHECAHTPTKDDPELTTCTGNLVEEKCYWNSDCTVGLYCSRDKDYSADGSKKTAGKCEKLQ